MIRLRSIVAFLFLAGIAVASAQLAGRAHRPPAPPEPPRPAEETSDFFADSVALCREGCAPRDAVWVAVEDLRGRRSLECGCPPISTMPPARVPRPDRALRPAGPTVAAAEPPTP